MPVAAIPAIVWASAAAGGASVAGAAIAAHGANEAAKTQAAAGNKALGVQQDIYNQQQQLYAPYRQIGQSILPSLAAAARAPVVSMGGANRYQPGLGGSLTLGALNGFGAPAGNPLNGNAPAFTLNTMVGPSASPVASAPTVRMQAPDGSMRAVPANQVAHYQSMGATVIGG